MKLIDISRGLLSTPVYPGDPVPSIESIRKISEGSPYNLSLLHACLHTGTHVDAPLHFVDGGLSIDRLPLHLFVGRCLVMAAEGSINADFVNAIDRPEDIAILLFKGPIEVTADAALALRAKGFITIGTEANTIGGLEAHRALLGNTIGIIENLDLSQAPCGTYFLFAPPIKIEGADGAFCRAVLIEF